jgi:hypothetical protein
MPSLRKAAWISFKIASGRSRTTANIRSVCCSNGDVLPPLDFAAELPVSRSRCIHLTAVLIATLKTSAASLRDIPAVTAAVNRSRKSLEYALGIAQPSSDRINADRFAHP